MTRQPRQASSTGFYHVVFRGVNHCHLFEAHEDYECFLDALADVKSRTALRLYAYCLMTNHVHLLVGVDAIADLSLAMHRLLSGYSSWFNCKCQRSGALIADRFKSECIEDEAYLLAAVRYVHQNPVAAGIVSDSGVYEWSSYGEYVGSDGVTRCITDTTFVLRMLADSSEEQISAFVDLVASTEHPGFSLSEGGRMTEEQIRENICCVLGDVSPNALAGLDRQARDIKLADLRLAGFSIRQIERATGISRGIIASIAKGI
jgi:REP element-mobilizing transposase RayT